MRTVNQTLLDALANQQGETILRVKTWASLAAYNAAPTVPEQTWQTNKFKIEATSAEAHLITSNDYTVTDFTVFLIERGVTYNGTEYVVQSGLYFLRSLEETDGRLKITGSSYPNQKLVFDGDDTYQNVITAFCTAIGKTAVFKDTGAAWLSYQFLPTGKQVILNKAERFESLIRQKYLIQCYERSPKELVFYHAATEQSAWKDIIFADSQLVLTASSGSHEIAKSTDGLAYTKVDAPQFTNAIAYSPTLDLFVAVGNGVCITSPDGVTWTNRTIGSGNWLSVAWDATIAKFVAIATADVAYSSNGTTWTSTNSTWTSRTSTDQGRSIAWSPSLGMFVTVGYGTTFYRTSTDGITWTQRTGGRSAESICWAEELGLFVSVGSGFAGTYAHTSPDGINWTTQTPAAAASWKSVCWSGSLLVAVASSGQVMTSPDGINWTSRTPAATNQWNFVCWAGSLGLFVAVASSGASRVMTSPDGITWTSRTAAEANTWRSVCWSEELDLLVAVSEDGTNRVMTSTDGITWTSRTAAEANTWKTVCWSGTMFAAVATTGTNRVMTSPDGINWTAQAASAVQAWFGITWSPTLSIFAAVADDTTTSIMTSNMKITSAKSITAQGGILVVVGANCAYTSPDGITWTTRTIPAGTYNKIIYADSLFVAVGESKCATSPDAISWTARTIPAGTYTGLAYSSTLDLFVAVGDNLLATSPDGITWTSRTPIADQAWQAVTWSDTLAKFFAVSSDGDNRIAASTDGINWQILTATADFSLDYLDGPKSRIEHGTNSVHFLWRDEADTVHTSGDTDNPAWNLGYLESTDAAPQTNSDPYYKFFLQCAPLRLDITDGDRIHFSPSWTLDPTKAIDAMVQIVEAFDSTQAPAWYQEIRSLAIFESVEGGSLPSTIERVSAYTPLVTSGFDGNLDSSVNNLQALAEAVDDLTISGYTPPTTTAANDFQVGDGLGAWIKKTLAETITILRSSLDSVYAAISKGVTNGDSHDHSGGDGAQIAYSSLSGTPLEHGDVHVYARQTVNQTALATNTYTVVQFPQEDKDSHSYFNGSTGKFQPSTAGTYQVKTHAALDNLGDGKTLWVAVRKNGTTYRWLGLVSAGVTYTLGVGGAADVYLNGTDYLEIVIWHNHGSNRDTYSGTNDDVVWVDIKRISASDLVGW